jgi:hypothetical protein
MLQIKGCFRCEGLPERLKAQGGCLPRALNLAWYRAGTHRAWGKKQGDSDVFFPSSKENTYLWITLFSSPFIWLCGDATAKGPGRGRSGREKVCTERVSGLPQKVRRPIFGDEECPSGRQTEKMRGLPPPAWVGPKLLLKKEGTRFVIRAITKKKLVLTSPMFILP